MQNKEAIFDGKTFEEIIMEGVALRDQVVDYLKSKGIEYIPEKWFTVKRYCEHFGIADQQIVEDWIRNGIVPPENKRDVEELNRLQLIKVIPYKD
ncbi:hypothetical protein [Emticicia sp. BO119]|uniref:hypothetical protein n=1 Tax=Emticicia sp. BO119 TaxID=2757768 RepID=UPI0015F00A67|nr:hypothetical protein [Emticicia sp. BO119]MBA4851365.1 hypothetical protein [Emticicia sp. BO119]